MVYVTDTAVKQLGDLKPGMWFRFKTGPQQINMVCTSYEHDEEDSTMCANLTTGRVGFIPNDRMVHRVYESHTP